MPFAAPPPTITLLMIVMILTPLKELCATALSWSMRDGSLGWCLSSLRLKAVRLSILMHSRSGIIN